jgi:hypothetical protein
MGDESPKLLPTPSGKHTVGGWTAWAGLGGLPAAEWRGNFTTFANAEWLKVLVRR